MKKGLLASIVSVCLLFACPSQAQEKLRKESKPDWVQKMNDPHSNYFETVEAFNHYWEKRILPGEAHEEGNEEEKDNRSFLKKIVQSKEKAAEESFELILEYKNFMKWQREMLPYVQSDGSVLSEEQRWQILKNQNANAQ